MSGEPLFSLVQNGKRIEGRRCAWCGGEIKKRRGRPILPPGKTALVSAVGDDPVYERKNACSEEFCRAECRNEWVKKHAAPKPRTKRRPAPDFIRHRAKVEAGQQSLTLMLPRRESWERAARFAQTDHEEALSRGRGVRRAELQADRVVDRINEQAHSEGCDCPECDHPKF